MRFLRIEMEFFFIIIRWWNHTMSISMGSVAQLSYAITFDGV